MVDILLQKSTIAMSKATINTIKNAYKSRQQERINSFFKCVEVRYDHMNPKEKEELNSSINSIEGQAILAEYADAITQTSSDRVRMAIALLYCNDPDYNFSEFEKKNFINGVIGITDHIVDFFIESINQPKIGHFPYAQHSLNDKILSNFKVENVDVEVAFSYINELIKRRLLLPDPINSRFGDVDGWSIIYGSSEKTNKMARLLNKAEELLG